MKKLEKKISDVRIFEYFIKGKLEFKFQLYKSEKKVFMEMLNKAKDEIETNPLASSINYRSGDITLSIPIMLDITARKKYLMILKEAIKDVNAF